MFALASASAAVKAVLANIPEAKSVLFFTDNQSAVTSIDDLSDHPSQCASIIFRKKLDSILSEDQLLSASVSWVPGHKGFAGNETADSLAKQAVHLQPALFHSFSSWAVEQAKTRALKSWRREWWDSPHTNLAADALQDPPSLSLKPFHHKCLAPRHVHTRIIQTILGHGFHGDYYRCFVPDEPTVCPCGEAEIQTREHIIQDCLLYDDCRHFLCVASPNLSIPVILSTHSGLEALAEFIGLSNAFAKLTPPEPPEPP